MNDSENKLGISPDIEIGELRDEVRSLRAILVGTLVVLILFSGSVNIFLRRQAAVVVAQAAADQKIVDEFNQIGAPSARDLWHRLNEYAKTHPNFSPIIDKYKNYIRTSPPPSAPKK